MFFYYHCLILSFQGGDAVKFTLYAGYQTAMLYMGALKEFLFAENFSYQKCSFWSLASGPPFILHVPKNNKLEEILT